MRIAVVIDNLGFGGAQSVCVDYVHILCNLGHEVVLYNLAPDKTDIECRLPSQVRVIHYLFSLNMCPARYYIGVRAYRMGKYAFPIIYAYKTLCLKARKAVYCLTHKESYDLAIAFSGHYNDLTFVSEHFIKSKKTLCWTHGALFQDFMTSDGFVEQYLKIKNIIVLNEYAQEEALGVNHFLNLKNRINIFLLYNPINMTGKVVDDQKVAELQEKYGDYAIMVARFAYPHKDQYTVVKAIKELRDRYNLKKNIVFLGDGPEREKVEAFAKELGIDDQCFFVGAHNDVQNYYKAAHMLVHSSMAYEGFPLILVEAMYYDIPVVSTDTPVGPRDALGSGEYGLLCNVQDYEGMAKHLYTLYTDPSEYEHYVEMGKNRREDFTLAVISKQLAKILEVIE